MAKITSATPSGTPSDSKEPTSLQKGKMQGGQAVNPSGMSPGEGRDAQDKTDSVVESGEAFPPPPSRELKPLRFLRSAQAVETVITRCAWMVVLQESKEKESLTIEALAKEWQGLIKTHPEKAGYLHNEMFAQSTLAAFNINPAHYQFPLLALLQKIVGPDGEVPESAQSGLKVLFENGESLEGFHHNRYPYSSVGQLNVPPNSSCEEIRLFNNGNSSVQGTSSYVAKFITKSGAEFYYPLHHV